MRSTQPRWGVLIPVIVVATVLQASLAAQLEPERPRVALTQ